MASRCAASLGVRVTVQMRLAPEEPVPEDSGVHSQVSALAAAPRSRISTVSLANWSVAKHSCRHRSSCALRLFRSEEHTSELQSLMSISYAVFCLKKKKVKQ